MPGGHSNFIPRTLQCDACTARFPTSTSVMVDLNI
ncbi:BQ5605_C009g05439 [Microbotryum silenes-dioicae]|uniref:BQ5605_C009g05439 protein n=1 Tax=Microbotryum silenes-dioicae TaxID=796604 RepID=A0A2X0PFC4_9BASI|nr:BQ5605_C009g05439 [Microbotryum silenes-dioicae]